MSSTMSSALHPFSLLSVSCLYNLQFIWRVQSCACIFSKYCFFMDLFVHVSNQVAVTNTMYETGCLPHIPSLCFLSPVSTICNLSGESKPAVLVFSASTVSLWTCLCGCPTKWLSPCMRNWDTASTGVCWSIILEMWMKMHLVSFSLFVCLYSCPSAHVSVSACLPACFCLYSCLSAHVSMSVCLPSCLLACQTLKILQYFRLFLLQVFTA